jgi:hypothetical protein
MKNITFIFLIVFNTSAIAQVAIGKPTVSNSSVSLEFGNSNRGLLLPWVTNTGSVANVVDGTMAYDLSDKRVKVKYAGAWKDLSVNTAGTTVDPLTGVDGAVIQNSSVEPAGSTAKFAIGTVTGTPGVLVLEDASKAMVLPKVASPHLNIINPAPGMIVYDTTAKLMTVFNGSVWTFWRP